MNACTPSEGIVLEAVRILSYQSDLKSRLFLLQPADVSEEKARVTEDMHLLARIDILGKPGIGVVEIVVGHA